MRHIPVAVVVLSAVLVKGDTGGVESNDEIEFTQMEGNLSAYMTDILCKPFPAVVLPAPFAHTRAWPDRLGPVRLEGRWYRGGGHARVPSGSYRALCDAHRIPWAGLPGDLTPALRPPAGMRDIQECIDSGFGLLRKLDDGSFDLYCKFDDAGNEMALALLQTTETRSNFGVTVGHELSGSTCRVKTLAEYQDPDAAGAAVDDGFPLDGMLWGHLLCMLAAWGALIPWGVAIAARGRSVPGAPEGAWFKVHKTLNATGWAVQLLGAALAIIYVSLNTTHFSNPHTFIGIVVVGIGTLQPLNAVFRPKHADGEDKSSGRKAWEILHKGSGYVAVVGGVAAIGSGIYILFELGFSTTAVYTAAVLAALGLLPPLFYALTGAEGVSAGCFGCFGMTVNKEQKVAA